VMTNDFAVIQLNSKQYIIEKGSKLKIDRVSNDSILKVLLAEISGDLSVGEPEVSGVGVKLEVIQEKLDKKVLVRRYKSKSRYRKNKGHRQPISLLNVLDIKSGIKNEIVFNLAETKIETKPESKVKVEKTKKEEKSKEVKQIKEVKTTATASIDDLDITDKMKTSLKKAKFTSIDEIKKATKEELSRVEGFGEKTVEKLLKAVKSLDK